MGIFRQGHKLEVTDNTGKPGIKVQIIKVLAVEGTPEEPEYFVDIMNPEPSEVKELGQGAYNAYWQLDRAVLDHKVFVKILN
jgi:hypothetical protein